MAQRMMTDFDKLNNVDWDFADAKTNNSTHSIHPYPAKYIPQIPNTIIKELSNNGDTVYDPFLGSGTTCVEANTLNRNSIGNDVNELAVLISKVKSTAIEGKRLKILNSFINKIQLEIDDFNFRNNSSEIVKPDIINLELWFEDFVINELVIIKNLILNLDDKDLIDFCLVTFSSIIVNVSKQDSDTRYVRVEKNITKGDVTKRFIRLLKRNIDLMNKNSVSLTGGNTQVRVADTRVPGIFEDNSADLAVTSPPYPNAYDYHLYHRYRLFWLEMSPYELKDKEIGSHADYSKKNGLNEFDFKNDMVNCFETISKILKIDKYLVLVIGDSILKGRNIKNNELLRKASAETPLHFVCEYSRNLNLRKKSFNPKIGNIKTEKILIFQNCK